MDKKPTGKSWRKEREKKKITKDPSTAEEESGIQSRLEASESSSKTSKQSSTPGYASRAVDAGSRTKYNANSSNCDAPDANKPPMKVVRVLSRRTADTSSVGSETVEHSTDPKISATKLQNVLTNKQVIGNDTNVNICKPVVTIDADVDEERETAKPVVDTEDVVKKAQDNIEEKELENLPPSTKKSNEKLVVVISEDSEKETEECSTVEGQESTKQLIVVTLDDNDKTLNSVVSAEETMEKLPTVSSQDDEGTERNNSAADDTDSVAKEVELIAETSADDKTVNVVNAADIVILATDEICQEISVDNLEIVFTVHRGDVEEETLGRNTAIHEESLDSDRTMRASDESASLYSERTITTTDRSSYSEKESSIESLVGDTTPAISEESLNNEQDTMTNDQLLEGVKTLTITDKSLDSEITTSVPNNDENLNSKSTMTVKSLNIENTATVIDGPVIKKEEISIEEASSKDKSVDKSVNNESKSTIDTVKCSVTPGEAQNSELHQIEIEKQSQIEQENIANAQQLEDDKAFLAGYISAATKRLSEKAELRATNLAVTKDRPELDTTRLDSSLKKNTAFIKKLRNLTEGQYPVLSKEVVGLNLSRYVGEAANALLDARLKMCDVAACIAMCSTLHQRYGEFAAALLEGCTKMFKEKQDEKVSNLSKLRVDLRLFAELVSAGIFSQKEGLPLLGSLLKRLVNNDKTDHRNVSVIVSFCRYCGEDYIGLLPSKVEAVARVLELADTVPYSDFLAKERQKNVRQLMKDYYTSLTEHILRQHKSIQREERYNRRLLETRGEVDEARIVAVSVEVATLDRLLQSASSMGDYLQEPLPRLPVAKVESEEGGLVLGEDGTISSLAALEAGDLWEDDDARAFYTNISQLRAILPSILYSHSEKTAEDTEGTDDKAGGQDKEEEVDTEEDVVDPNQIAEKEEEDDKQDNENDDKGSITSKGAAQKAQFSSFLAELPNCISRGLMDAAALEFCVSYNTRPLRQKLARALFLVPRNRQDLLPFYARLTATLLPLMPDMPQDLIYRLKMDFRYQVKKKDQVNLESKVKVCRFLGELVKFSVFSGGEVIVCLRMLLADFRHHHIEMACAILESAGRFLYRTPATHHRTKLILEQMMRKKTVKSFEARYDTMIENAYYYVNPPESSQLRTVPPLPPMLQYVRYVIVQQLNKTNVERMLRVVRKLDWDDRSVADYCVRCLTAAWDIKYLNIKCLANLVSGLIVYHEWVAPAVVDSVLEDIRVGLESNLPHYNQRRIAAVKYLAELYNYKVIESTVVFKVLYSLITFGAGMEGVGQEEFDPPEHLLRLRLVVTVLDTCGGFFSSGLSKKKLDCFLTYFQHYYQYKRAYWSASDAFPVEYDQQVVQCLSTLRPDLPLHDNISDATDAVNTLNAQLISKALKQAPELREFLPDQSAGPLASISEDGAGDHQVSSLLDEEDEDEPDRGYEDATQGSNKEDNSTSDNEGESTQSGCEEVTDQPQNPTVPTLEPIKCEEDDDFLAAFDRLMTDTLIENSRDARPAPPPLAAPLSNRGQHKKTYDQLLDESRSEPPHAGKNIVQFSLMARNSKQQLTTIAIPEDSDIVTKMRRREKQEQEERLNVKRVTLEMTERQEEEEAAQELLLQQRNTAAAIHRERRVKYQHPKGAPDADLIFGSSRHKKTDQ